MAGIGFQLRKILDRPGYLPMLRAYGYAALIGSGPWVFSIVSLAILGLVAREFVSEERMRLFFLSVTYIYALSLIVTGPTQMILTRYAADQDFLHKPDKTFSAIVTILTFNSVFSAVLGLILFLFFVPAPLLVQLSSAALYVLVTSVWITSVYLSASKNYRAVINAFFSGYALSFAAAWAFSAWGGADYTMLGLVVGHSLLLLLLLRTTVGETGSARFLNLEVFGYFKTFLPLALCGFFYNLGIWIDKIIFWFISPDRLQVAGILHASPLYDQVVYLSFLTAVPGMAVFLLKLETDFAIRYADYVQQVLRKGTYRQITEVKHQMVLALQHGFAQLVKVQGLFTLILIVFARDLLRPLGLGAVQVGVFQVTALGVFLLVLFLSLMTVLFYLSKLTDAMICCLVFALINGLVTLWSISGGERWYGFGFFLASGIATALAVVRVNHRLALLEYETFTSQTLH
jgi:uncharacterized membrane protein